MKISTNAVNNYTLQATNKLNTPGKVKKESPVSLSNDEKDFFVDVYPKNKSEIMDYHYYGNNGKMAGVAVGSNIDRRG